MRKKTVKLSKTALNDLLALSNTITFEYKSPYTAKKYSNNLLSEINKLQYCALSIQPSFNETLISEFGYGVRRINFKKIAIIFTVHNDVVFIRRIIPQSCIRK